MFSSMHWEAGLLHALSQLQSECDDRSGFTHRQLSEDTMLQTKRVITNEEHKDEVPDGGCQNVLGGISIQRCR